VTETENKGKLDRRKLAFILLIILGTVMLAGWLINTPSGIFGKAGAIGYAICHRIDERSFHIGETQFPMCARDSGMFLGALLALAYQLVIGKKNGKFPPKGIMVVLAIFLLAFAVDGTNSFIQLLLKDGPLYQTTNFTRLITGTGVGLGIGLVLYPLFNQTVWVFYERNPVIDSWKKFGILISMAIILDLAVLSSWNWLLAPLALLSALSVYLILAILYTTLVILVTKQDNKFLNYSQLKLPFLMGLVIALGQIVVFNYLRFMLTGTWAGFPSLP
jgi:uncharacterized membrane protein